MSIAISEDHRALAATVRDFLTKNGATAASRDLLEADEESRPAFWAELASLGWLGIHLPEQFGGSGFGLPELVVIVEEMGRAVAPGPFVPTVIAAGVIADVGGQDLQQRLLPALAAGKTTAGVALYGELAHRQTTVSGTVDAVLSADLAGLLVLPAGDDVVVVDPGQPGVKAETPKNLDPARRSARLALDGAACEVIPGARRFLLDLGRLVLAAEATGIARQCTELAAEYAKVRHQFGRPIAMFQAVKHHCANMLVEAELATAAVWEAARVAKYGGERFSYHAGQAAALAGAAAVTDANLNTQVHGGIGYTWEHDAHLYLRRAAAISSLLRPARAAEDVARLATGGVRRSNEIELPAEAEPIRDEVRAFVSRIEGHSTKQQLEAMLNEGYAMPHWPRPWGRQAGAIEQLVIEQEFKDAGIQRPAYGITGWIILTLIQYATEDQISRWVRPALHQDVIWCQLFSEPDAGSDAAGIKTRGRRVEGGWVVNGQKVWTSGAHLAGLGLATVRTNPEAPKHKGITMMVIDMHGPGVSVRPLRQVTGQSEFNEVFFNDVFVPDDDVVGPEDGGWTIARATLGNESVSIGGGSGGGGLALESVLEPFSAHPDRLEGGAARVGRYVSRADAAGILNLRSAHRAVAGGEPGPEGAMTKLLLSENGHEAAAIMAGLAGDETVYQDGAGELAAYHILANRGMSIAGGTSEIKRNQIGERLLGLPRDPLLK